MFEVILIEYRTL